MAVSLLLVLSCIISISRKYRGSFDIFSCSSCEDVHSHALPHSSTHPRELGAHLLGLLDQSGFQHVLGTLGVDEAVGRVQGLGLVHPSHRLLDVAGVLPVTTETQSEARELPPAARTAGLPSYLVDLGLDEEELDQRGRAVDGCVDAVQSQAGSVGVVKVLRQEVLDPEQRGGRLLLPIVCADIHSNSH